MDTLNKGNLAAMGLKAGGAFVGLVATAVLNTVVFKITGVKDFNGFAEKINGTIEEEEVKDN